MIYGTTASGLDLSVEETAPGDVFPGAELARAERGATIAYSPTRQGQRGTFAIVTQGGVELGLWQR